MFPSLLENWLCNNNIFEKKQNKNMEEKSGTLQVSQTNKIQADEKIKKGRFDFATKLSASVTVEASLVLPVVFITLAMFIFLIQIISFTTRVQYELYTTAKTMSTYSYDISKAPEALTAATAQGMVVLGVGTDAIDSVGVNFGSLGINMFSSKILEENDEIDLVANYYISIPLDLFDVAPIHIVQRAKIRGFVGYDSLSEGDDKENDDEQIVYITRTGKVYHLTRDCTYISPVVFTVKYSEVGQKRNSSGGKYYECELCNYEKRTDNNVYITEYGTAYHNTSNCSAIKKGVTAIKISEVDGRTACKKCGEN